MRQSKLAWRFGFIFPEVYEKDSQFRDYLARLMRAGLLFGGIFAVSVAVFFVAVNVLIFGKRLTLLPLFGENLTISLVDKFIITFLGIICIIISRFSLMYYSERIQITERPEHIRSSGNAGPIENACFRSLLPSLWVRLQEAQEKSIDLTRFSGLPHACISCLDCAARVYRCSPRPQGLHRNLSRFQPWCSRGAGTHRAGAGCREKGAGRLLSKAIHRRDSHSQRFCPGCFQ